MFFSKYSSHVHIDMKLLYLILTTKGINKMNNDLKNTAKLLENNINFFYENGDEKIANKVYDVIDFIENLIYDVQSSKSEKEYEINLENILYTKYYYLKMFLHL